MNKTPTIAFLSAGRSHLYDLSTSLRQLGVSTQFYSDVPKFRLARHSLDVEGTRSLFLYVAHLVVLSKLVKGFGGVANFNRFWIEKLDWAASRKLGRCDLLVGLSGLTLLTAKSARLSYGAKVWIERGSTHILEQKKILDEINGIPDWGKVPDWVVDRELEGYELADRIIVPSLHVERSFIKHGISKDKLFRNPYGVNLRQFAPTRMPTKRVFTLIFVGGWCYRKGCDLLIRLMENQPGIKLIHVGDLGDCPVSKLPNIEHVGHVSQNSLIKYYRQAHALILPSREEGLSLVQAQALACGLPVICSDRTGGEDLAQLLSSKDLVTIFPVDDFGACKAAVNTQFERINKINEGELRDVLSGVINELSWEGCAKRYLKEVRRVLA